MYMNCKMYLKIINSLDSSGTEKLVGRKKNYINEKKLHKFLSVFA